MFKWFAAIIPWRLQKDTNPFVDHWESDSEIEKQTLSRNIDQNIQHTKIIFDRCNDLITHEIIIGTDNTIRGFVFYLGTLVKEDLLQKSLLRSLLAFDGKITSKLATKWLTDRVVPTARIIETKDWTDIANYNCQGFVTLLLDGQEKALLIQLPEDIKRPVSQPISQNTIMGPSEAFNEDLRTNIGLLRKRLPTTRLAVEEMIVGVITKTTIDLVYLKDLATEGLINEIKTRVKRIEVDGILDGGQIEEHIQDSPYSLFSCIDSTERPDRLAARLLDGSVGLIINGTPYALIMPTTLANQLTASDDYNERYWYASFIRFIRWTALIVAALAPGLYVAVITYHQELIPPSLLLTIVSNREGIPFPAFAEALIMELTFEVLREAGIRLPRTFGQTIGIVGTIVIGQAAVSAGLVSSGMVVIVAITAIASYSIPSLSLSNTIRLLRFFFMASGAVLGLFGVISGISLISLHAASLRSFGVPYLSPIAPVSISDLKDTFIRMPNWMMKSRPRLTGYKQPERQGSFQKPNPPQVRRSNTPRK